MLLNVRRLVISRVLCATPPNFWPRFFYSSAKATSGSDSHLPYWKAGSGHYGATLGQKVAKAVSLSVDHVLSFIDSIPISKNKVFTIGDYGTNDGYSSMTLMSSVIEHLRKKHGDGLTIQVIYEDQEKNDFNSLFKHLSDSSSYVNKFRNVYPLATNINFYRQCVPEATCDLVFTSIATHWLESVEGNLRDCAFDFSGTEEEQKRFRLEAARDWSKFLVLRAKELKPGGLLVAISICSSEGRISEFYLDYDRAWTQLRDYKTITQEEFERCTFALRFRTAEEIKSPFEREGSEVRQSGLRLMHYDEIIMPCTFKDQWRQQQMKDGDTEENRAVFADSLVEAHRVWSQTTFHSSLSENRTESEKDAILDELYRRFHALVMTSCPEDYRSELLISRLTATKLP